MKKNFIFNPSSLFTKNNRVAKPDDAKEEYFTLVGREDFMDNGFSKLKQDDNENVFAKKILRKDGSVRYMVKISSNGKLYNPLSIYGMEPDKSFLNRVCRSNKKFKEVNSKAFDWYLKFLTTKNMAWLNNAEREME